MKFSFYGITWLTKTTTRNAVTDATITNGTAKSTKTNLLWILIRYGGRHVS